jgi:uncharacterized lipoprotein YajG
MRHFLLFALLASLAALGCAGKSTVDLNYAPVMVPGASCSGSVALVRLADARTDLAVAVDGDEQYFPTSDVSAWVTGALREQLSQAGCRVEAHDREYAFDTDFVLTGQVEEVFTRKLSTTSWQTSLRVRLVLRRAGQKDFVKSYGARYEKPVLLPTGEHRSKLLEEALQDVLKDVIPELLVQMRS